MGEFELEIIEEYYLNGEHRYRIKDKKSGIVINVSAENKEEAAEKAVSILAKVKKS